MLKRTLIGISLYVATTAYGTDAYTRHCVPCHAALPVSLGEMFKRYLEVFSSERYVKIGLKHYLRYPDRTSSLMTPLFLDTIGVKKPVDLDDATLDEALDTYWEKFKVFDKLK